MRLVAGLGILAVIGLACAVDVYAHSCRSHRHGICTPGCSDACQGRRGCWNRQSWAQPNAVTPRNSPGNVQANVESMEGSVSEVNYLPGRTPDTALVEITVGAGPDHLLVRLGPAGFLRTNHATVREGDSVRVTGYRVTGNDVEMLVATELTLGGKTLRLRDERGRPVW